MQKHYRFKHEVDEQTCEECGKVYQNRKKLMAHYRVHVGVNPDGAKFEWTCDECNFVVRRTTEKGLERGMASHKLIHSAEGRPKPFLCEFCSKSFATRKDLESHMNAHMGIQPFSCTECNMRYSGREALDQHFRRSAKHKGQLPSELWATCASVPE